MNVHRHENAHKDPVCGMSVSSKAAAAETTFRGRTYYFCADICREKFQAEPERYLRRLGAS